MHSLLGIIVSTKAVGVLFNVFLGFANSDNVIGIPLLFHKKTGLDAVVAVAISLSILV
jgi:hypothetical protein